MAAVVRLKRHLDEEPLSALILNCKKRKRDENSENENEISTILTFAGTVNNQEDDISPHIYKLSREDLEKSFKKHVPNVTSKLKQQTREASEENRFKIVNLHRSIDKEAQQNSDATTPKSLTVLDVITTESTNEKEGTNFVYDLYYTDSEGISNSELDTEFHICPANELIFDDGLPPDSDHDSDDSNDENNWRNDYPEDEDDSIDEDDMIRAVERISIGSDEDSSIDNRPDGFMYSIDSEAVGFEEDVDCADGRRYGELYARFKMRQKKMEDFYNKDLYHDEIDDTDDDYYD